MNNGGSNDYDELEPRVTPQPTVLKCTTAPSVPEVSIIFGKRPEPTNHSKTRNTAGEEYGSYASWKKDEFPASLNPKVDSRYAIQFPDKSPNKNHLLPLKPSNDLTHFSASTKFHETPSINYPQNEINRSKNLAINLRSSESPSRNSSADHVRPSDYDRRPQSETLFALPYPRNKPTESPSQRKPYEAVKSILKSSQFDRTEPPNLCTSPEHRLRRKIPPQYSQTPRNLLVSDCPRSPVLPRYHCQTDANSDQGTVQDLLLLVKNQNEQIKCLQSQVERLLQAHEESIASRSVSKKSSEFTQTSPHHDQQEIIPASNGIAPQKSSHSRGTKIPSSDDLEACLRYQSDQMRNTIVEQKVSIGVMTSFEFSVHNNPFVTDSSTIGKNLADSSESRRANICSRNVAPATLENINEDSESHPSSLWKLTNSNTHSSSDRSNFKRILPPNEKIDYGQNGYQYSPFFEDVGPQINGKNDQHFYQKSAQPPVPAPRKFSTSNRERRRIPAIAEQRVEHFANHAINDPLERESKDPYRANDRNNYNRATADVINDEYLARNNIPTKNLKIANREMNSLAAENVEDVSLVLSGSELKLTERPPSPDPSIHVEMREYSSDDDDEKSKCAPPVGWTFYKNIVGQVNRILHTIPDEKDAQESEKNEATDIQNDAEGREEAVDSVKLATLERLKMLGISYAEHSEFTGEHVQKKVTFDSSYCPRLDYQAILPQPASSVAESNTSLHMKALALKYLSDEQLADLAVQKQGDGSGMKQKILNSIHGTNMSLATMNYLQRYCLVSGVNTPHTEAGKGHVNTVRQKKLKHVVMTQELHAQPMPRQPAFNDSASKKKPDNILDITTLKQQPKLL